MTLRLAAPVALACLVAASSAGATGTSTITRQDNKAKSNARNIVSGIESCFTETEDYSRCRSAAAIRRELGPTFPVGSHPGQVRVVSAAKLSWVIDAYSRSGNHFRITKSSNEVVARICTKRARGGCPKNGHW